MSESPDPNLERIERLEASVAWLLERERQRQEAPAPRPAGPPRPAPRPVAPPKPRREINPIVWVAAGGSLILLLGAAFALRWSIEQGWLGLEARVLLGILAGAALSVLAARLILGEGRRIGVAVLLSGLGILVFSLRAGAFHAPPLFPPVLGFAGTAFAVLLAGGLAGRAKSGGALSVALGTGLLAPLFFSQGGHHEVALALYLALLAGAAIAVPYLAGAGATWGFTRWLGLVGPWLLLAGCVDQVPQEDAGVLLALLALHLALAGLWIWLPRQREAKPRTPTLLWMLVSLAFTGMAYALWGRIGLDAAWFSAPVLGVGALNLLLVRPCRSRLGGRQADLGLLALAAGHLALAVPVALAWRWVGLFWSVFALAMAVFGSRAEEQGRDAEELRALRVLAWGFAILASLRWLVHGIEALEPALRSYGAGAGSTLPFLNLVFAEGLLAAGAWLILARRAGPAGVLAWIGFQVVGNLALAFEAARLVRWGGGGFRAASVALTVVWALSGALQWLRGLTRPAAPAAKGMEFSGYAWLGLACAKLLLGDLAGVDTPLRALAFLAVGGIVLAVALLAFRSRQTRKEAA